MKIKTINPQERKIVLGNFVSLTTLQGISYILPLIILPYLIRVIGLEHFGLIAFAQALAQYFMILTDYGFSLSATRKISLYREEKEKVCAIFSSVMTVKLILALLSFLILLALVNFIPKFKNDWLVYVFSFGSVIGNTLFPTWYFQGTEKMKYIFAINIIGGIIYIFSIFAFVKTPEDYLSVPLINSFFFLTTGVLGLYTVFRKFKVGFIRQTYGDIRQELKAGWDIFISIVAINAYTTSRVFAVGLLTNNTLTGYYSIGERIANVVQTFPLDSFSQAIYPRLTKIFSRNKKRALMIMRKIQDSTTSTYSIVLPFIFLTAPWITRILCGAAYPQVTVTMRLLLLSVFFVNANAFKVQFLLVGGRSDIYSKLHVIAALVGLPLIFLLINYFSYLGAALSTIMIEAGIFLVTFQIINSLYKKLED